MIFVCVKWLCAKDIETIRYLFRECYDNDTDVCCVTSIRLKSRRRKESDDWRHTCLKGKTGESLKHTLVRIRITEL